MNEAILKAIEGGYYQPHYGKEQKVYTNDALLDPTFWQALGKALGWEKYYLYVHPKAESGTHTHICEKSWLYHWHLYIDHIASDKDPELFWKEILK